MDLDTYQTLTISVPDEVSLSAEDEIEYLEMDGQRKIV
jgi:translation initiation factor 5A